MAQTIIEVFQGTASKSDVLEAPSRLTSIPRNGVLTVEYSADVLSVANHIKLTIQTPEGDVPMDAQPIPANGHAVAASGATGQVSSPISVDGILDNDTEGMLQFVALRGGHYLFSIDVVGTGVNWVMRFTLEF